MSTCVIGHSRAARRWIGALLVLVFGVRALVPNGFMLAQVGEHLTMVVCLTVAPEAAPMPGMHHDPGTLPHQTGTGAHRAHHLSAGGSCPFALSGGAMLASRAFNIPAPYFLALRPARAPDVLSRPATPPPRHESPRGPPSLV